MYSNLKKAPGIAISNEFILNNIDIKNSVLLPKSAASGGNIKPVIATLNAEAIIIDM